MKKYLLCLLVLVVVIVVGCTNNKKEEEKEYSIAAVKIDCNTMKEKIIDGAYLIDVRSIEEYKLGTLDFAINVPVETIENEIDKVVEDKDAPIILFCRSGNRSATAAQKLIDMGYTHIFDLGAMDNCSK